MNFDKIISILSDPNTNGILEFVLGFLFMLFSYHLLIYLQNRNKIYLSFDSYNLGDRYNERIEIVVYRVFQELSNNINKHAQADRVEVQLFENGKNLILIVEDNGKGMTAGSTQGIGLYNIESRLSTVNGKVDYTRGQSGGTIATVVIPV